MKKQLNTKKLTLNKKTITKLSIDQSSKIFGGRAGGNGGGGGGCSQNGSIESVVGGDND